MEPDDSGNGGGGEPAAAQQGQGTSASAWFALSAAAARAQCNPATDWDRFVEALWHQVSAGFGLTDDVEEYPEVPRAWFDHPDDPPVVVWDADQAPPSQR